MRPLVVAALTGVVGLSFAQDRVAGGHVVGSTGMVTAPGSTSQTGGIQLQVKPTPVPGKTSKVPLAGIARPRTVFPQISNGITPKIVSPENPSITNPVGDRPIVPNPLLKPQNAPSGGVTNEISGTKGALFPGLGYTGYFPPDTSMGVGPDYIIEAINVRMGFFQKTDGKKVFSSNYDQNGFLNGSGVTTVDPFDPRSIFDKESGRYYSLILDVDFNTNKSYVILCVSTTNNPFDPWYIYKIDTKQTNSGADYWNDYPQIGFTSDTITISCNMFGFSSQPVGPYSTFEVIDKASAINGGPLTKTTYNDFNSFCSRPVRSNTPTGATSYSIAFLGSIGTTAVYRVYALDAFGTGTSADVQIPNFYFGTINAAPILSGAVLDTIPGRMFDATLSNGNLAAAHTLQDPGGTYSVIGWLEVSLNNFPSGVPTIRQSGKIDLGGDWAYQPAISTNEEGHTAVVFTKSGFNDYPNAMLATRRADDALGTMRSPLSMAQSSNGLYFPFLSRWGDYAGIQIDPLDKNTIWGCNDLLKNDGTWSTTIFSAKFPLKANTGINANSVTPIYGTPTGGDVTSFNAVDSNFYSMDSQFVNSRGDYAGYELSFTDPDPKTRQFTFTCQSKVGLDTVAGYIYCYNNVTDRWDLLASKTLDATLSEMAFTTKNLANYKASSGEIKVRVLAYRPVRRRGAGANIPYTFDTDFGQVTTN